MDEDLKQHLLGMEQRLTVATGNAIQATDDRLERKFTAAIRATEDRLDRKIQAMEDRLGQKLTAAFQALGDRLSGKMRDMQTELLKAYLSRVRLCSCTIAVEARVAITEGRLAEIEKKLLLNPPTA
jgi:hypothetical protein